MRGKVSWALILVAGIAVSLGAGDANALTAQTKKFSANISGSSVTVPLDLNGNASCTTTGGVTTCTALSYSSTFLGRHINGIGNTAYAFTGQSVTGVTPVAGTGCSINDTIASCTLGAVTDACSYTYTGGSLVNQKAGPNNQKVSTQTGTVTPGGSLCVDYTSPTPNFSATINGTLVSGNGDFTGITGSFTETISGAILNSDLQGHAFGWFSGTISGTESTGAVAGTDAK
jgi:hypothetical protein